MANAVVLSTKRDDGSGERPLGSRQLCQSFLGSGKVFTISMRYSRCSTAAGVIEVMSGLAAQRTRYGGAKVAATDKRTE
jgi:hypothetical protein